MIESVELKGKRLGTYHKLRSRKFIHIAVWVVLLIISIIILAGVTANSGLFGGSGFGIILGVVAFITFLMAIFSIIANLLGFILSNDMYLEIYEDGFKVRRSGKGLMMARNGTKTYSWMHLGSYRIDTNSFHSALGYAGSPDPISGLIVKLLVGIFTQVTDDVEYNLTITFSMVNGKKFGFTELRGDNFRELTEEILPELLKTKRRMQ